MEFQTEKGIADLKVGVQMTLMTIIRFLSGKIVEITYEAYKKELKVDGKYIHFNINLKPLNA